MANDTNPDLPSTVESGKPDWANLAMSLIRARDEEHWRNHFSSFTEYLNTKAANARRTPFTYWRAIAAAEFYLGFGKAHPEMTLPALSDMGKVSPENLEFIEKIGRFAPEPMVVELMNDLLAKKIGRSLLKSTWEIYRSAYEGAEIVHLRPNRSSLAKRSLPEAAVVVRLLEQGSGWCCSTKPEVYKFFPHVRLPVSVIGTALQFPIDAGISICPKRYDGDVELHGVFTATKADGDWKLRLDDLRAYRQFLDHSWIATLGSIDPTALSSIPEHIGVVEVVPEGVTPPGGIGVIGRGSSDDVDERLLAQRSIRRDFVRTVRPPISTKLDGSESGTLAKRLLAYA